MKALVSFAIFTMLPFAVLRAEDSSAGTKGTTGRVAFAQYCFWTGEMKLGQIEGVVRTEAGYFQRREVTLVDYDPARISLDKLASQARRAGVADRIYLPAGAQLSGTAVAGVKIGEPLDGSYRTAPASDQKKQLEGTPYAGLKITSEQATKVNAFVRVKPSKALEWIPAALRDQMADAR